MVAGEVVHPFALPYAASGSAMISATLRIPKPSLATLCKQTGDRAR